MNKTKGILFFGPLPPPITGQSIAFRDIYENISCNKTLINTMHFGNRTVLNNLYAIHSILYTMLFERFDIVYFTCSRSKLGFIKDFILITLSYLFRKKIICHLHGADFNAFYVKSGLIRPLIMYAYNRINGSIVLLDKMKEEFRAFDKMNLFTVHNSYSKIFDLTPLLPKGNIVILYFSNIMASKGILEFLDSAISVLDKFKDIKYLIAGSFLSDKYLNKGEVRALFEKKILEIQRRFGSASIRFLGSVTGLEKVKVFQASSIFVLPTYYETEAFPLTIIEAMRMGNAIISTHHNYIPEIVGKRNGILVPKKSVSALIEAQEYLIQNPTELKRIQAFNFKYASANYFPQKYVSQISKILNNI